MRKRGAVSSELTNDDAEELFGDYARQMAHDLQFPEQATETWYGSPVFGRVEEQGMTFQECAERALAKFRDGDQEMVALLGKYDMPPEAALRFEIAKSWPWSKRDGMEGKWAADDFLRMSLQNL